MWATTHMRGNFFASLRTTSRCEGLHSQIGRYVDSGYNLTEFLVQFNRCLDSIRNNEVEADFRSAFGFPVMQTHLEALEQSAAKVYTREVFLIFRSLLKKVSSMKIGFWKETTTTMIFSIGKYCDSNKL